MGACDLQVNGYAGADFCSADLTPEALHTACEALREDGVSTILATVITDSMEALCGKLQHLVRLREDDPLARELIHGFHVEGPFLNPETGWIGAHPTEATVPPTPEAARQLLDAGQDLVKLVTLAPECDAGMETIQFLANAGIVVSAGHCNPSGDELDAAIDAGLKMFTHLGNGCPIQLDRHDNIITRVLHRADKLWIGFIPDGAHIPFFALNQYLKVAGEGHSFVVTDAIAAARLGPGVHRLSGMQVEVDDYGVARKPGTPYLAGSTITMPQILKHLENELNLSPKSIERLTTTNPRAVLGLP